MKRIGENQDIPRVERDIASETNTNPTGSRATYAATLEVAYNNNGSLGDIEDLRGVYEKNGKTEYFNAQLEAWKGSKTERAKQAVYESLTTTAGYFPEEIDLGDEKQAQIGLDAVTKLESIEGFDSLEAAQTSLLKSIANGPTLNPDEKSIHQARRNNVVDVVNGVVAAREQKEADYKELYGNMKFVEEGNKFLEGIKNGSITDLTKVDYGYLAFGAGGEAARFFVPFHDEALAVWTAKAMGVPDYLMPQNMGLAGEAFQNIRNWLSGLTSQEQAAAVAKLKKHINDHPDAYPDVIAWDQLLSIDTPTPVDFWDRLLRNAGSIGNYVSLFQGGTKMLNWGKRVLFGSSAVRTINAASGARGKRVLATLLSKAADSNYLKNWNLSTLDVAHATLPKPPLDSAANVPSGVAEAAAHIQTVREELGEKVADARFNIFTPDEQVVAIEKQAQKIAETFEGRIRINMSDIGVMDDGSGVRFGTVIGSSDTHGWSSLEDAQKYARSIDPSGETVRILEAGPDGQVKSIASGPATEPGSLGSRTGEFYVKVNQDYFFRPEDKLLFGDSPMVGATWLGRLSNMFLTPSAILDKEIYGRGVRAFLNEGVIAQNLDRQIAPFFKELSWGEQRTVGQIWEWTEAFGKKEGRLPKWDEIRDAFPDVTDRHLTGWYQMRNYWDSVYFINNDRLYKDFSGRGYKTLYTNNVNYHGSALELDAARRRLVKGSVQAWDPVKQEVRTLSSQELKKLYEEGGGILETPLPISYGNQSRGTLVLHTPGDGSRLGNLSKYPLKYTPGYYTRIYRDNIFIRRREQAAIINGHPTSHSTAVMTARDRRSADDMVKKLNAERGDDTVEYFVDDIDPRLADKDRVARDLEGMQLEGRMFFDDRNMDPLASAHGGMAETLDPINAMRRVSRALGRQVAMEDLVLNLKAQFKKNYGHLLEHDVERATSEEISTALRGLVKSTVGPSSKTAGAALQLWDYIRVMEGSLMGGGVETRRAAVRAAEFIQRTLFPKGSKAGALLVRNAEKVAPIEWLKSLAFFDFMTTRPLRQLVLQGSQHIFLAPLDIKYAVRWQRDSMMLMSGARARNLQLAGMGKEYKFLRTRNAKLMGISLKEYDELVKQFDRAGLSQAVNMHTFASDVMKMPEYVPETIPGKVAQVAGDIATAKPIRTRLNRYGFQAGEGFNVAASYMMAVRRTMKEKGLKKITQLTQDDWAEIQNRGSNYALAMHRANASSYQYGWLSLPMQFMSFTHKVLLTFLQSDLAFGRVTKLGNKAFTPAEANKLLFGQFVMFGAAGFGMRPEAEQFLTEAGLDKYKGGILVDILAGGFVDILLDKSIQKAVGDPELDLPFSDFLAPGANFVNLMRAAWEAGMEKPIFETLLGPSAQTTSRLFEAHAMAGMIFGAEEPEWSPQEQYKMIMDATLSGLASGYNDYLKAKLAWKTGVLLTSKGMPHHYHATREEALAMGLFGVTSEGSRELWALTQDSMDKQRHLTDIAKTYFDRMQIITQKYANEGSYSKEYFLNAVAMERSLISSLEPEEQAFVMEAVRRLEENKVVEGSGIGDRIMEFLTRNVPLPTEWLIYRLQNSNAVDEEDKPHLIEMLRNQEASLQQYSDGLDMQLEDEYDIIENTPTFEVDEPERLRAKALASTSLREKADIARQLGASEEDIAKIMAKAPRSEQ